MEPTTQTKHEITNAVEDAKRTIANAVAEALRVTNAKSGDDHDLIIRLDTKMDDLKTDIKELKDGTASKIEKHEIRLGVLENNVTRIMTVGVVGLVLLGVLEFIINKYF